MLTHRLRSAALIAMALAASPWTLAAGPSMSQREFEDSMQFLGWLPMVSVLAEACQAEPSLLKQVRSQYQQAVQRLRDDAPHFGVKDMDARLNRATAGMHREWREMPQARRDAECTDFLRQLPAGLVANVQALAPAASAPAAADRQAPATKP